MKQIKTAELTGSALDWVVTKCEYNAMSELGISIKPWVLEALAKGERFDPYSTDWLLGGPIIEREKMAVLIHSGEWAAQIAGGLMRYGQTPLIAAMQCYVASKLGDTVEVPEGLC